MKKNTIGTLILATTLSIGGLSYAVAATTTDAAATNTEQSTMMKEDGSGKNKGGKHRGGKRNKQMGFQKLDLTDIQKQEMKTIITAHREANNASRLANKAEMKALMEDPNFDETKAAALIAKRESQRADKQLSKLEIKHQMYQLLTDEQKVKYDELEMKQTKKMKRHNR